ncbi:MAG: ROK family protein [Candidatus Omnitrophica bacterium]|nr:ROK family protein [Candidatus Omnitrophota bacterium]
MQYAIGIDIGGTKISLVIGNSQGKIMTRHVLETQKGARAEQSVRNIIDHVEALIRESKAPRKKILGIGIGIPGPVDSEKGIVPRSPHMTGWTGISLGPILSRKLKLPVFMTNDANAAALGEKMFGEGRREKHFVYLTISTGIGGGLVSNGQLIEGASFMGGEVGHMKIVAGGRKCKCGKLGCLEAYASGTAIASFAAEAMGKGKRSTLRGFMAKNRKLSAKEVGLAAQNGDRLALEVFKIAGFYLGVGISNLLHLVNPGMVVLGGGVLKSSPPIFWKSMIESCKRASWSPAFQAVRIQRSRLKDKVGDLGALALVFEKLG